jgi:hypothetical protein
LYILNVLFQKTHLTYWHEFYENPSSDFYMEHKKDFLKYVEEPVKYILSQVEEQLPDFIKKYINIKHERIWLYQFNKKIYNQQPTV